MRQNVFATAFLAAVMSVFSVFLRSPDVDPKDITHNTKEHVFQVPVLGKKDTKPGSDVWAGATAFITQETGSQKDVLFDLVPFDDEDADKAAKSEAEEIQNNPRVLAVIGHSLSGTTRAAADAYAQARIPFVIPIATGQATAEKPVDTFRLRPSDNRAQAPAIVYLVSAIAKAKVDQRIIDSDSSMKVHLVISAEPESKAYADPLANAITKLLKENKYGPDGVSPLGKANLSEVIADLKTQHDQKDVIVVCAYPSLANRFMAEFAAAYTNDSTRTKPTLIFSEAATDIERTDLPFVIYRTVPEDVSRCHSTVGAQTARSAEFIAGFDAVDLISVAIQLCGKSVSRACVADKLQNTAALPGACHGYSFRDGESILSSYFVFKSKNAPVLPQFAAVAASSNSDTFEITADDIIQLQARSEIYGHDNH
jgi:ABC-type branched-subunit amino acid transport system substrate-binding protein